MSIFNEYFFFLMSDIYGCKNIHKMIQIKRLRGGCRVSGKTWGPLMFSDQCLTGSGLRLHHFTGGPHTSFHLRRLDGSKTFKEKR